MRLTVQTVVLACSVGVALFVRGAVAETLFYDDFSDAARLKKDYTTEFPKMAAGKDDWVIENGLLRQKSKQQGDMSYAIITARKFPAVITIQAKVRVDEWENGDTARAGIAVRVNTSNGQGYTFLVHNTPGRTDFLNDWVKWGKTGQYPWKVGEWYFMQMHIDAKDVLYGKMWGVKEQEPKNWQLEQPAAELGAVRAPENAYPALNGGTSPHGGMVTDSFDEVHVWDAGGPTLTLPVEPKAKLATTWATLRSE
jgi:hypothetical protein